MEAAAIDVIVAVLVEDLMTNGGGQRASRLKLVDDDGRDLGGWSASALQARIRRHFEPLEDTPVEFREQRRRHAATNCE